MTRPPSDDSDSLDDLSPAERFIYDRARRRPDEPFCYLDFKDRYAHGTIRNVLSRLKRLGLIKLYCQSICAFYVHSSSNLKQTPRAVTTLHTVGRSGVRGVSIDFRAFLESLEFEDICKVHNVTLVFSADRLYGLVATKYPDRPAKISRDVPFDSFQWDKGRMLKVVLHRNGQVTCYLKCADCPIEVTIEGLVAIAAFLGGVRNRMVETLGTETLDPEHVIPKVRSWIVAQWHYGKDGIKEISGPAFNVTFSTWCGELARIYMRKKGHLYKPRLEVAERPGKTLPEIFAEKMQQNTTPHNQPKRSGGTKQHGQKRRKTRKADSTDKGHRS